MEGQAAASSQQQTGAQAGAPGSAAPFSQQGTLSLYVGNLAPDVVEATLYEKFGSIGPISSVRICRDSMTRRSLGYAYVNFTNAEDAKRAIEQFNFEVLFERPMRVMYSQRDPSLRRSGLGNIFISNLHKDIDNRALHDTFQQFGNILSCKVSLDAKTGQSRGYGFVHFATEQEAKEAIQRLNNCVVAGQVIHVYAFKTKQERQKELELNFQNVFVKNIPPSWNTDRLNQLFGQFGTIKRSTVRTKEGTGESKEYGFVEFESHEAAKAAVEKLNGYEVEEGRNLIVMRAQKKSERIELHKRGMLNNPVPKHEGENLYVKNLDDSVTEDELRKLFEACGNVKNVKIMTDSSHRSRGFGFVSFNTQEEATKAVTELNCKFIGSKPLYVAKFQRKHDRQQQLQMQYMSIRQQQSMPAGYSMYPPYMMPMQPYSNFVRPPRPGGQPYRPAAPYRPPMQGPPMAMGRMRPPTAGGNPQAQPRGRPPMPTRRDPLTASNLAAMSERDQKQTIGERLYPLIEERHGDKAGKITGMLLEMDNSELLHLLEDQSALIAKEQEALRVLQEHAKIAAQQA